MTNTYKIGELAERLGTTVRTIRYYEEAGLLSPLRSKGGTRHYNDAHVARLHVIRELADSGFSLDAIRLVAKARERCKTGDEGSRKVSVQLDKAILEIDRRLGELQNLKIELDRAKSIIKKCRGCQNRPTSSGCPTCPVKQRRNDIEMLSLIWDQQD